MSTVLSLKQSPSKRLKIGMKDSWYLVRSPDSLYLGLKKKWLVPALLFASLLLVPAILLPTTHFVLEKIYPPVEQQLLFGLVKSTHENELLEVRKVQAAYLLWGLAGIGIAIGLVVYAPIIRLSAETEKVRLFKSLQKATGSLQPFNLTERYRIDGEIGHGAMGVVSSAFDQKLQRDVALKELPSVFVKDPGRRERFRREALTLAKLTHPGIVHIYDLLDDGDRMILVMELVRGGTLEDLIASKAPVAAAEACHLIAQVCGTLDHLHQKGIIHRDLKPANILIDDRDNLKVTDFGMARLTQESSLTLEGSLIGTPHYMSPEQAAGKSSDYRSDIYSLGVIFYELLSGSPPFIGEPASVLVQKISNQPPRLQERVEGLNLEVEDLVMRMLKKDPDERLSNYKEITELLEAIRG